MGMPKDMPEHVFTQVFPVILVKGSQAPMAYLSHNKRQKRRNRHRFTPAPNGKPRRTRSGGSR
ncbi:MAG: hypothetical protein KTR27_21190 [Leptolyngbyaceae cyanobacterium MAG.088]|nr:hypothetical protein [Leptolyngbyaceae cyanobacterium MAG.088]